MKPFLLLLSTVSLAAANQPLTYQVEHINLPNDKAVELMHASISGQQDLWPKVQGWVEQGTATSLGGSLIATASSTEPIQDDYNPFTGDPPGFGNCSISGQVEWLYATEFDPPEFPNTWEVDGKTKIEDLMLLPIAPTAMECCNVGFGFDFENSSDVRNGMKITTHITQNHGTKTMGRGVSQCWMPKFHSRGQSQTIQPRTGQWILLTATERDGKSAGTTTTTWLRVLPSEKAIPQTATRSTNANLILVAEWYTIDASAVDSWLLALTAGTDNSAMHKALLDLVDKGKAQSIAKRLIKTSSNERVSSEAENELIYNTEYDPSEPHAQPQYIQHPSPRIGVNVPTAFEIRELGPSIEILPTILGDSGYIDCHINAQNTEHDIDHNMGSKDGPVYMPFFVNTAMQTRTILENGKPRLIGVVSKPVRTFPATDVTRTHDIKIPPKYELSQTARTVVFLSVKIDE